jgi:rhomboid family protein
MADVARRVVAAVDSVRATTVYAAVLVVVGVIVWGLGPRAQETLVDRMSTNLHNLTEGHLGTLVGSAFITDDGMGWWLLGLVCLLASAELIWRSRRLVYIFVLGHVGATLIVAVGLALAIHSGWQPDDLIWADDVGVSYGAAAVVGALTAAVPRAARPAWAGWWLGVAILAARGWDFTAVGHALALMLGMGWSLRVGCAPRWTLQRLAMLAAGLVFGYLVLSGSAVAPAGAGLLGALIAVTAHRVTRRALARFDGAQTTFVPCASPAISSSMEPTDVTGGPI